MSKGKDEFVDLTVDIQHVTDKAFLASDGSNQVWLPKSQLQVTDKTPFDSLDDISAGSTVELGVAEWIAKEKGLI